MTNTKTAYLLARLPIGISFLCHGLVRLPKLTSFAEGMASSFEETLLPYSFVLLFGKILPLVELVLGIGLLTGFFMRKTTVASIVVMCVLIFGSCLRENWSAVATQLFYSLYLVLLYLFADHNGYSLTTKNT